MNETGTEQHSVEKKALTVSVVTCCYNQGSFLAANIESVLSQKYPVLEHIVVDDGSTDDTQAVCLRYPQVTYVHQKNAGQSAALNNGFARAKGDVIVWLNSDDALAPGALDAAIPRIDPGQGVYIVMGHADAVAPDGEFLWKMRTRQPDFMRLLFHPLLYRKRGIVCMPCQPALFFHRKVYETIGPLDCSLKYGMDYDYWLRAFEAGFSFTHLDHVLALYRYHPASNSAQGFDLFLPEWTRVAEAHLRKLSTAGRVRAEWARIRFYRESAQCRRRNAYTENVYGINRHLRVHRRPEEVDRQAVLARSPLVSVMLHGEPGTHSAETVRSLLAQSWSAWELWMDESAVQGLPVEEKTALLSRHTAMVHVVSDLKTEQQAIEAARKMAQGEFAAFIRMGDQWHPEKLEQQVVYMAQRPSVAATYTPSEVLPQQTSQSNAEPLVCGSEPPPERIPLFMQLLTEELAFSFSSVMIRRDALPERVTHGSWVRDDAAGRLLLACAAADGWVDRLSRVWSRHYEVNAKSDEDEWTHLNHLLLQCDAVLYLASRSAEARHAARLAVRLLIPHSLLAVMQSNNADAKRKARNICLQLLLRYPRSVFQAGVQYCELRRKQKPRVVIQDRFRANDECLASSAKLVARLQAQGVHEVALYGAGKHTRRLLELGALKPLNIAVILDDQPSVSEINGIPVRTPSGFSRDLKKRMVVIPSSDTAQTVLIKKAKKQGFIRVERIYTSA